MLVAVLVVTRRGVVPAHGERIGVVALGAVGYMTESTLFFMGLERGTAAAVTLLFYSYPAVVVVLEALSGGPRPGVRSLAALVMSAAGTAVVVAAGSTVSITPAGILCALASAVAVALYLLASDRIVVRTPPLTAAAVVALSCGLSFLLQGAALGQLRTPRGHLPAMAVNGLATAAAFAFLFAALARLGAGRTSVAMTLEAVFAVVLAAVVLGEALRPLQAVGGVAVLTATVLVATAHGHDDVAADPPPVP